MKFVEIIADEEVYRKHHAMTVKQIIDKMESNPNPTRPKAKRKWQEKVYIECEGNRYLVICHKESEMIVIKKITKHREKNHPRFMMKT
ncbi:MAG: hypothetical protein ACTSXA_00185 [Candidatus Heimdallarchaeota archaeon]